MQNGYVERFNRTYREDILDAYLFANLKQVKQLSEEWIRDYNAFHPHQSLNGYSPIGYRQAVESGKLPALNRSAEFTTFHSSFNSNNHNAEILTSNFANQPKSNSTLS